MYVGIDIGGSKTLIARFDNRGVMIAREKFPTPHDYDQFIENLGHALPRLGTADYLGGAVAVPGRIDRDNGLGLIFGHLPWKNVPLAADIEKLLHCPVTLEHDPSLAALAEATLLKEQFSKVLYVTISTGIGAGLVVDGQIDKQFAGSEAGMMLLEYRGKHQTWESFASGKAIYERYGKPAHDITDPAAWHSIARNIASGLMALLALTEPDVVVLGGSIGTYFKHFEKPLEAALKQYEIPMVPVPPIRAAAHPEEAVVYGAYELAKQEAAHGSVH
jgi:predicted NBD/HSP70 family sugar kinase